MKHLRMGLIILASCLLTLVLIQFLSDAWTSARWQIKALAIHSMIGGEEEAWWTASPFKIAAGLIWNNTDSIIQIIIAVISGVAQQGISNRTKV